MGPWMDNDHQAEVTSIVVGRKEAHLNRLVRAAVPVAGCILRRSGLIETARTVLALAALVLPLAVTPWIFRSGGKTMETGYRIMRSAGDTVNRRVQERRPDLPPAQLRQERLERLREIFRRREMDEW